VASLLLIFGFARGVFSQDTPPANPPAAQSETAAPQPKGLVQRPPDISAGAGDSGHGASDPGASGKKVGQITLDVTVTDAAGQTVPGLAEGDFTLLDNHQPAKIASFRSVDKTADGAAGTERVQAILLLDEVNNSFQSVAAERDQIVKYLGRNGGRLPIPISIALFSESGVKIDQPTQEGSVLIAELEKMLIPIHTITSAMGGAGSVERYQLSLKALNQLVAYTQSKPGKKLLLWIGPGWPMLAGVRFGSSEGDKHQNWDAIVSFSADLRRSRTALYSVNSLSSETGLPHDIYYQNFLKPVATAKNAEAGNLALPVLALQSGGRVLNGTNDLAGEIASCLADAGAYYTIAIEVSPSATVNEYRALEVKLGKAGLNARTNAGFYNQPYIEPPPADAQTVSPAATLRTEVRLVVVDAVVLDKKGAPVTGLKTGDFVLKEDGVAQKLWSVEEHKGGEARPSSAASSASAIATDGAISASNTPVNAPATWNVLLVDQFNTTPADQANMLRQLKLFVKQLPVDEPVALAVMSSQMKVVVPFADGAGAVARYLDKNSLPPVGSLEPPNIRFRGETDQSGSGNPESEAVHAQTQTLTARTDIERQGQHAQKTLDNFSVLAKLLINLPGRKNVYWLSGGFPLQGQAFDTQGIGLANTHGQMMPMQATTDKELETARVAIYPIDAQGVAPPDYEGLTSADTSGPAGGSPLTGVAMKDQLSAAQTTEMLEIAKATGGVATFNNDIAKTLRHEFDRSESYYTISYTPAKTDWNGAYRRIQLSLNEPGTQLIYREGYYAKDLQSTPAPTKEEFREALVRGAPVAADVLFSAKVSKSAVGANVEYTIDPRTLQYQAGASGQLVAAADCAIVEYDAKGKAIATSLVRVTSTVSPERRAALNMDGLRAKQTITLKAGAASVVLGVRDQSTGRFGNLEVGLAAR
jgi:VWFA-related protein